MKNNREKCDTLHTEEGTGGTRLILCVCVCVFLEGSPSSGWEDWLNVTEIHPGSWAAQLSSAQPGLKLLLLLRAGFLSTFHASGLCCPRLRGIKLWESLWSYISFQFRWFHSTLFNRCHSVLWIQPAQVAKFTQSSFILRIFFLLWLLYFSSLLQRKPTLQWNLGTLNAFSQFYLLKGDFINCLNLQWWIVYLLFNAPPDRQTPQNKFY